MSFEDGFAVGLKLRERMDAAEKERLQTEIYNKIYNRVKSPDTPLVEEQPIPKDYVKGTGFGGQETMMPPGAISFTSNQNMVANANTVPGYNSRDDVITSPLRTEGQIMDTSAPTGFATDPTTDAYPTSPYGSSYEQTGAQSPADMPYGFGAIPKDYQPMEGNVDTTPTQESPVATADQTAPPTEKSFYLKTVEDLTAAQNKMNSHQDELNKIKAVSSEMRSKGLWKEAENFETKAFEAQKNLYESTDSYYKTVSTALDFKARLANSFLNAVKDGVPSDLAWNQVMLRANTLGIPGMEEYSKLQGEDRIKFARMVVDEAMSTKDRLGNERLELKNKYTNERFNKTQERLKNNDLERERNNTFERELKTKKLNLDELKTDFDMSNKKVQNIRADIKAKQERIDKLRKGDYITDEFGMVLEGPERQREASLLGQEITALQGSLTNAETRLNSIKPNLPKSEIKAIEKNAVVEATVSKITPEIVDQVTKDINNNPTQIAAITKAWEELHPGTSLQVDTSAGTIQVVAKEGSTTTAEPAAPATKEEQIKIIKSKIDEIKRDLNPKERRKQNEREALDIAKGRGRAIKEFFTGEESTKAKQKQLDDLTKQLEALQSS